MKRFLCGPEQHSADKVLCILMAVARLFLLTGTVIPLRINHTDASRLWASPGPESVWWCPSLCVRSLSLQEPTFLVFCPRAAVALVLDLSLQPVLASLKHAGQRPTSLDVMHTLSWDAGSVWAADEPVQMRKYIKEWNVRFWLHHNRCPRLEVKRLMVLSLFTSFPPGCLPAFPYVFFLVLLRSL